MGLDARFRYSLALVLIAGCSSAPSTAPPERPSGRAPLKVDAIGGTVTWDGVVIDIPPGALSEPTTITIENAKSPPPDGVTPLSPILRFGPPGLQFRLPVTVTMDFQGDADDAVIYWDDGFGTVEQSGMVADHKVTTSELHFSTGFVSHLSKWRETLCDNSDEARKQRAACAGKPGDICLDNMKHFPIQYVFVLMMENHSFDNYFGRFQAYLRGKQYDDARTKDGGIEVPGVPYELRDAAGKAREDGKLDLCTHNPRVDAPFNPPKAGISPKRGCDKHYWRHASGFDDQCVADTCHEWWCSHMQVDNGLMDGFFESNDGFWEGGEPNIGYPPSPIPADWYDRARHPNAPSDGSLLRGDRAMLYYDETNIPFYYWLADAFGLGDHYFSSVIGPTFVNRDFLYGATSRGLTNNGSDTYGAGPSSAYLYAGDVPANPPAITYTGFLKTEINTIYDDMYVRGIDYTNWVRNRYSNSSALARYGAWYGSSAALAAKHKYTYDNQTNGGNGFEYYVQQENALLLKAIAKGKDPVTLGSQGQIFPVNFIDPDTMEDVNGEDEHPPGTPQMGQKFSYDVIRVLMSNPEVWKRSVLFITWDEHGGFYDHVNPPPACPPDAIAPTWSGPYGGGPRTAFSDDKTAPRQGSTALDSTDPAYGGQFDQYGLRVPLLVVSPWAKHQYVSSHTYDHTSLLRFIEARFGMPAITARDANADPLFDFFDFSDAPAKLKGTAPAAKECIACTGKWGTEQIPKEARFDDAASLGTNNSSAAIRYQQTASARCLSLFPPLTPTTWTVSPPDLGRNVFGSYDWSRGLPPPGPVQCGGGGGGGGGACCMPTPCPLSYRWCASECSCAQALACPPGDFILGGCQCCAQFDFLDPQICLICDPKMDVFQDHCPGG